MSYPPLLYPVELSDLPGAPFSDAVVLLAGERIRDECGWHIAPSVTETLTVDVDCGRAFLPSMRVTAVSAVRDVTGTSPVVIPASAWRWRKTITAVDISRCGVETIEVDITHGYDTCPTALLGRAAELARRIGRGGDVRSEQVGGVAYSYAAGATDDDAALLKYALPVIA